MVLFKKLKSHRKINTRLREQADRKHRVLNASL